MILLLAALSVCCLIGAVALWYLLPDLADFSSFRDEISTLDQLIWGESPNTPLLDIFFPDVSVTFENATDFEICTLFVYPNASPEIAEDLLGGDEFMFPGDIITIEVARNTVVDYVAYDCFDNQLDWGTGLTIGSEDIFIQLRY